MGAGKGTSDKTTGIDTAVIDLSAFNKILNLDVANKTITVQMSPEVHRALVTKFNIVG